MDRQPSNCPACGQSFDTEPLFDIPYERLGPDRWQCENCGHVIKLG